MYQGYLDAALNYITTLGPTGLALNAVLTVAAVALALIASFAITRAWRLSFKAVAARIGSEREGAFEPPKLVTFIIRVLILAAAVIAALSIWGIDVMAWASGQGAPLVAGVLRIGLVLVGAVVIWEIGMLAIGAAFHSAARSAGSPRRSAQLRSLGPMIRGAIKTVISIFAGMIIISQLGVEIGPLLAGAGVVGIAIGFGAQTIVKDYLTGFSLILEDIASVGDIVRIGDHGGLVETMTLRTIRLRDFDGTLHIIPCSEAQTVHNLTKTFSYYVFNIPISYDSSIDEALSLMRDVGAEMKDEAAYADSILEPIEVVGVDQLADSGVVLKARIKTAPIKQWGVGREYNRRIKLAFDAAGIEIPVPHMKLQFSPQAISVVASGR